MELKIYDYDYYDQDLAAKKIKSVIDPLITNFEGMWLYREPEIKTEGQELPTFTILSPSHGLIFIKAYNYNDETLYSANDKFWVVDDKKVKNEFMRMRNYAHKIKSQIDDPLIEFDTKLSPQIVYLFPYIENASKISSLSTQKNEILYTSNLENFSIPLQSNLITQNDFALLTSIVQNANIINPNTNTYIEEPAQNAAEAIELNNKKIARFDYDQMEASLTITQKSERIRGLAGSGKTVLLAMKAARLHKRFPEKKIAFIFYTKSLYTQTINLIRKYYNQIADNEPNWDNLLVLHSWGGATTGLGFYSYICKKQGIQAKPFNRQGSLYKDVCKDLIDNPRIEEIFDFILVDEAQDFPLEFFLLVEKVAKNPKKVVIAYDELQTTNDIVIPQFEELFGETKGKPNITLDKKHDYILKKSYRNTLDILVTAFSFGFGFYNKLTQIIQDKSTWKALGFEASGEFSKESEIIVTRPKENSPNSISDIYNKIHPLNYFVFNDDEEVVDKVVEKILCLIETEGVIETDILVIDIKMNQTKILNKLQNRLSISNIESHIPGVVTDARDFFQEEKITLTTPRNAKGNEVPIVFVVGCEEMYLKKSMTSQRQVRNFMFISMTRSKGWVYLYASGRVKTVFLNEIEAIKKNIPSIKFLYPSDDKIKELSKIDFLTSNPKAKALDDDLLKLKKSLTKENKDVLKALLELDPELKNSLKEIINDEEG